MNRNKPTKVKTLSPPLAEVMILYIHFHIPLFFFLHWTNDFTNSFIYPTGLFHIETMIYIFIYISHLFHIESMISNTYPTEACLTLNQWFQLHIQLRFVSHWNNDFSYISNWGFFFRLKLISVTYPTGLFQIETMISVTYPTGLFHIESMISVAYSTEVCFTLKQWFQLHIQLRFVSHWNNSFGNNSFRYSFTYPTEVYFTLKQWF